MLIAFRFCSSCREKRLLKRQTFQGRFKLGQFSRALKQNIRKKPKDDKPFVDCMLEDMYLVYHLRFHNLMIDFTLLNNN